MNERTAPYQSCIGCYRGDTTTAFVVEGEVKWHTVALSVGAGLTTEEATATLLDHFEHDLGCEHGHAPEGRYQVSYLLCPTCAAKNNTPIYDRRAISDEDTPVIGFNQPE